MSSPQRPNDLSSSLFSNSILRPSILSGRLVVTEAAAKTSESEPSTSSAQPLVEDPQMTTTKAVQVAAKTTTTTSSSSNSSSGFIFGQNMSSRVINVNQGASKSIWQAVTSESQNTDCHEESVFTTLAKAMAKQKKENEPGTELLEESAVALVNKRNAEQLSLNSASGETDGKPHEIITGEENERTVLGLTCSAYVFNRDSKQWKTIGQSYLHLNDPTDVNTDACSRLIIRLQSTRKVVVNTRVWPGMPVAFVPENKAVRFGALALAEPGSEGGGGEDNKVGTIRTYMLRFGGSDTARQLYDALLKRRGLGGEQVEVGQKRTHLLEEQNVESSPVPVKVVINSSTPSQDQLSSESDKETSDSSNQSSEQQSEGADNAIATVATTAIKTTTTTSTTSTTNPPPPTDMPTELIPFSFHCERVILTNSYSNSKTKIEAASIDPPNSLMVNLVDFPRGGTSIIEVSSGSGESHLTTSINERLAFCRHGDSELQLFYPVPASDAESENGGSDDGEKEEAGEGRKICRIVLTSTSDAEKLYRSILMRVGRHFLRAVGLFKERKGRF
ncbi:hypothetical protein Aperf_G00000012052 [Anoplocephala perfoliata]